MFLKDFYEDENSIQSYKEFIVKVIQLMNSTNNNLQADVTRMVELEIKLAKVFPGI
jgi:hypothetical protein